MLQRIIRARTAGSDLGSALLDSSQYEMAFEGNFNFYYSTLYNLHLMINLRVFCLLLQVAIMHVIFVRVFKSFLNWTWLTMMDYIVLTDWIINFDNSKAFDDRKVFHNPILVLNGSMGVDNPKILVDPKVISTGSMNFDNPKSTVIPVSSIGLFQCKKSRVTDT